MTTMNLFLVGFDINNLYKYIKKDLIKKYHGN